MPHKAQPANQDRDGDEMNQEAGNFYPDTPEPITGMEAVLIMVMYATSAGLSIGLIALLIEVIVNAILKG